jgi:hypothetical protein
MWIIISPYTLYGKVNHKLSMLKKITILEKARKPNMWLIKG